MFRAAAILILLHSVFGQQEISIPPPTMKWYLGQNCVGTPGGVVQVIPGCADYIIFGSLLTLVIRKNNNSNTWTITSFSDVGCGGSIGVLFANVPYPGADTVCTADTTLDR